MLFIAEKPSVARAIAEQLGIVKKSDGYITCKDNTVTWCFGHLLELAEPDEYLPDDLPVSNGHKIWRWEDLPIVPEHWKLKPKKDCKKQIKIIADLLKTNTCVVNCGDPDREGQLLIDELLEYLKYSGEVKRYWCNAVDQVSVQRALKDLKDNQKFLGMKYAAEARSRADWLVGMNMSRAYTLASKQLVTIGRVQSPTLKLVVDRDRVIDKFKSKPYYLIKVIFDIAGMHVACDLINDESYMQVDSENRLVSTDEVKRIITELSGTNGCITDCKIEDKFKSPPLCLSLSDVQSKASALWGYSADTVLQICQSLYEKKLTTYPRTDCNYLPESQFGDVANTLKAIEATDKSLSNLISKCDHNIKTKLWNDSKTTAHHAIIPTMTSGDHSVLSDQEQKIYNLVAKYYIANFYENYLYNHREIIVSVNQYKLRASGNTTVKSGWRTVLGAIDIDDSDNKKQSQKLPNCQKGDGTTNYKTGFTKEMTSAPARFTEGSLIKAMENIYKYTEESEYKKILKDGDGIGTSATRAGIITELKNRKFLEIKGKNIVSTELGRSVVDTIPVKFKTPALTAIFERILSQIEQQKFSSEDFINKQLADISSEILKIKGTKIKLDGVKNPNVSKYKCSDCGGGLIRRQGKNVFWWGCENYPKCKKTFLDKNGKPVYNKT